MPSKSPAQARLMRAVAHGWKPDKIKGPTRAVAREFVNADRRKKVQGYNFGGVATDPRMMRKPVGVADPRAMPGIRPGAPMQRPPNFMGRPGQKPMGRPDPRAMPPRGALGQVGQAMMQQQGMQRPGMPPGTRMPGPRMAPPMNQFPGGGNPNLGGRNPMNRQMNAMRRGPTSYLR